MSACDLKERYLDRRLDGAQQAIFEGHLENCDICREEVERWGSIEEELGVLLQDERVARQPSGNQADAFMAGRPPRGVSIRLLRPVAVGLAAAALLAGIYGVFGLQSPGDLAPQLRPIATSSVRRPAPGRLVEARDREHRFELGRDRIGLSRGGRVRITRESGQSVRLELLEGTIACQVDSRQTGGEFVVTAGARQIRVVGTRFAVALTSGRAVRVGVEEGIVELVSPPEQTVRIVAGQEARVDSAGVVRLGRLSPASSDLLDELLGPGAAKMEDESGRPKDQAHDAGLVRASAENGVRSGSARGDRGTTKQRPNSGAGDLETLKKWIVAGRIDEAMVALGARVNASPTDAAAWSLLADCHRKRGRYRDAVEAYRRIVAHGSDAEANRARFKAGVLLQEQLGRHQQAAQLFFDYRRSAGGSLRAEAGLRLARSLIRLDRLEEAGRVLEEIVTRHAGSPGARQASEMLEGLGRSNTQQRRSTR
jgi:TolA-binding protein